MNFSPSDVQSKPLRLLPGVIIVTLQMLIRFILPIIYPKTMIISVFGGLAGGIALIIWWVFFSRAPRLERWGGAILVIISLFVASRFLDESIARSNMGLMFTIYSVPVMSFAFVAWAVLTNGLRKFTRRLTMILTVIIASCIWILLRTDGMTGDNHQNFAWRWSKTSEEKLLQESAGEMVKISNVPSPGAASASWPGFRGSERDGIVKGVRVKTDWQSSHPDMLWRKPVGPGCGSFAVNGNLFFTQEQRGEFEDVSCYELTTGNLVWQHRDKTRFYEPHAGAGPRSTPSISGNTVFTLGATGLLNALDLRTGQVKWLRTAATEAGVKVPGWGFSGSPLVVNDIVVAPLSGKLVAYDTLDGKPRWTGPDGGGSYSSPQLFILNNFPQILFMSDSGAVSLEPESGKTLWEYKWKIMGRILQPSKIRDDEFMISGENKSIRRITIRIEDGKWSATVLWDAPEMSYFNDFVLHNGYAYGFDGPTMTCIDLKDGKKLWKGSRYRGFQILLPDQDLIIVLTEKGEIAMVKADPLGFREIYRFQAINGRTWSHPVLAGGILLVRNAEEMAAYKL